MKLNEEMKRIVKENLPIRQAIMTREEAKKLYDETNTFKGSVLENYNPHTTTKQYKTYRSPYDYEDEEDDPMIWDKRFGYIRQSDKDWYDEELGKENINNKPKGRRGRPKKK